jgi:hypothetical protein
MAFGDFTVTRASTKNVIGSNGLYQSVANNVPAFEFNANGSYRGLLVEPVATNLALNSRNLTTASWSATNVTTAQTATGADGGANSATTLTASAGNGTVLQAITSASASRVFSAVVRRRTGTGTVEITQDNGSTWTAITLTTSFQRFTTSAQTLTNPTVGFRIVTSGDAIDVDFCQAETGSVATSPIVTTGSTASRVGDSVTLTGASSLIGQSAGTLYVEAETRIIGGGAIKPLLALSDASDTNRIIITKSANDANQAIVTTGGVDQASISSASNQSGIDKYALAYAVNDFAFYVDGVQVGTDASGTIPATSRIDIGQRGTGATFLNGWIRSVALFPTRLPNATLVSLTTP